MVRILLATLFLMAIPFVVYAIYETLRRGPDGLGARRPAAWESETVTRLGLGGCALAIVGFLALWGLENAGPKDGRYEPARYEDGKLIPGRIVPATAPDEGA